MLDCDIVVDVQQDGVILNCGLAHSLSAHCSVGLGVVVRVHANVADAHLIHREISNLKGGQLLLSQRLHI